MPDFTTLTELYGVAVAREFIHQWFLDEEEQAEQAYWQAQAEEEEEYHQYMAQIA